MADVRPFRGLRYNPRKVSVQNAVTQPYDKISPEMQERYYALDPHNIVRVILGKGREGDSAEDNVYTRAAAKLREWRAGGVIEPIPLPSFWVYFQRFVIPGTAEHRVRKGFIGLGKLEDYSSQIVYPHERTLAGPKQDRLQLLRHTRTHFEQIFMLYDDQELRIDRILDHCSQAAADIDVVDEYGVSHSLWLLTDAAVSEQIVATMKDMKLIIADGHHRYETALAYRDEMRGMGNNSSDAAHEWLPMTFFNMRSPALTVLATHRVVSKLKDFNSETFLRRAEEFFDVQEAPRDPAAFAADLRQSGQSRMTIGVATSDAYRFLTLKPVDLSVVMQGLSEKQRALDVAVLQRILLERCLGITLDAVKHESNIQYVRELDLAMKTVAAGKADLAFLLNPIRLDQMRDIVYEGNVM